MVAVIFAFWSPVCEALGLHSAGRTPRVLALEAAHLRIHALYNKLLHGDAEGQERQIFKAYTASAFLVFPTFGEMLGHTMETHGFMKSVFLLQVFQRRRVIFRCLTLLTARAAFHGLHSLLLEGF